MEKKNSEHILIGLDRVHTISIMMGDLLGSVDGEDISDVHVALKPHAHLLLRAQESMGELYQLLGNDLYHSEEDWE
ncbi:hypothetical protein HPMBJEAJ_00038 [Aeromonas phage avDM6]|nr:hypothetical protein HPMBJEAJ_00038 [Aeromonas phage avDM6]